MKVKNVFFGVLSVVTNIDYDYNDTTYHTKMIDYILFYKDDKTAIELVSKNKYSFDPTKLDVGQQFVDIKNYQMVPFSTYINEMKRFDLNLDIKANVSRRKIFKTIDNIEKEIKKQELENVKKLIKIVK